MNATVSQSKAVATIADHDEGRMVEVLQNSLYPGAKPESVRLVLAWCKATGRDPMKKPVHIVPMFVEDKATGKSATRDVLMLGITTYRSDAATTGQYVGKGEPEFGEDVTEALSGVKVTFPKWCKVTVQRLVAGEVRSFTAKEYWIENYATAGRSTEAPNAMWKKRPYGQISKCAESQALRMAFPDETGNTNTMEEMEGKPFDGVTLDAGEPASADATLARKFGAALGPSEPAKKEPVTVVDWSVPDEKSLTSWLTDAQQKLDTEENAWSWIKLFIKLMGAVENQGDIESIMAMPVVANMVQTAPDQPKAAMIKAKDDAVARLTVKQEPVTTSSPKEADKPAEEATSEPTGQIFVAFDHMGNNANEFMVAMDFARWYQDAAKQKGADKDALAQHNADGIEDAIEADPATKPLFDVGPEPIKMPRMAGGVAPDWVAYNKEVTRALERITTLEALDAWVEANQSVYYDNKLPRHRTNFTAVLEPMINDRRKQITDPAQETQKEEPNPDVDRDMIMANTILSQLAGMNEPKQYQEFVQHTGIKTFIERVERDRPDIFRSIDLARKEAFTRLAPANNAPENTAKE